MRLVSKIYISYSLLLLMALSGAFMSNKNSQQVIFSMQRAQLSHEVYQQYLSLSSHAFQLFKQFTSETLITRENEPSEYKAIYDEMQNDLSLIRHFVGLEIDLVGDEEIEELDRIADIDTLLDNIVEAYVDVLEMKANNASNDILVEQLRTISEAQEKSSLKKFIKEAIDQEEEDLIKNRAMVERQTEVSKFVSLIFVISSLSLAMLSLWIVIRDIGRPLRLLQSGVNKIASGELSHRIDIIGPQELKVLAEKFNRMADEVMSRDTNVKQINRQLEQKVADRTKELKRLLEKLQQNEKNRRQLMADVSHELRTPLTIIRGEADIALRGDKKSPSVYIEALEKTRSAAIHTTSIVDDLLFVAKRESGETRLKLEKMDIVKLLISFTDGSYNFNRDQKVDIEFVTSASEIEINADPMRLQQVVLILIENAINYAGGKVTIYVRKFSSLVEVKVKDHGPGIPKNEQSLVFERFFRGPNSSERYDGGAGLGLPIAKAIVEAHNGEIHLESQLGEGTEITFTLPIDSSIEART